MKIFKEQCAQCHTIGSTGAKNASGGTLDKVGASQSQSWIEAEIRHPDQHNPKTGMPLFPPDRISEKDLHILGHYLASLK